MALVAVATAVVAVDVAVASPACKGLAVTIGGTPRDDVLAGTRGADVIHAGPGDDVVDGRGGRDVVCGGPGLDLVAGGRGNDRVFGNEGADVVGGGPGSDLLDGDEGHDVVELASAKRPVRIDLGANLVTGQGHDRLDGLESAVGGRGDDVVRGTDRVNLLAGGPGDDRLFGLAGDDVVQPLEGHDLADGGPGQDLLSYSLSLGAVSIDPVDGDGTERLRSFEALQGSTFSDVIGGTGRDDVLLGGPGGDQFRGGPGDDYIDGEGIRTELDEVVYEGARRGVVVDLQAGRATGQGKDVLVKIDAAVGSPFDDVIVGGKLYAQFTGLGGDDRIDVLVDGVANGGNGADVITGTGMLMGEAGDDELSVGDAGRSGELFGGPGNDVLTGGAVSDRLTPGPGDDSLVGGEPSPSSDTTRWESGDSVSFAGAEEAVFVDLVDGTASGEGTDELDGIESVEGSAFDDVIIGSSVPNALAGGAGNDRIDAGAASDHVNGGAGNDEIWGREGDDWLTGDEGFDTADGGEGHDVCTGEQRVACEGSPAKRGSAAETSGVGPRSPGVARATDPGTAARQTSRWGRHHAVPWTTR